MKVSIIIGSDSDWPIMKPAAETLKQFGVEVEVTVASAHRTPARVEKAADIAAAFLIIKFALLKACALRGVLM